MPSWRRHRSRLGGPASWRRRQWRRRRRLLALHVYPRLGHLPVTDIETRYVVDVLEAVRVRAPGSVDRVRQRIAHVMDWVVFRGFRPDNPCGPALAALRPPRSSPRRPRPALPYAEVPDAVASVRDSAAWVGTRLLFELVVLTVVRPGDARAACWSEVDLENAVWTVPAERSATRRRHRVPLSSAALAVLGEARDHRSLCEARLRGGRSDLLFPSVRGRVLSSGALSTMLKELGIRAVPFGFRHSFLAWATDLGVEAPFRAGLSVPRCHALASCREHTFRFLPSIGSLSWSSGASMSRRVGRRQCRRRNRLSWTPR